MKYRRFWSGSYRGPMVMPCLLLSVRSMKMELRMEWHCCESRGMWRSWRVFWVAVAGSRHRTSCCRCSFVCFESKASHQLWLVENASKREKVNISVNLASDFNPRALLACVSFTFYTQIYILQRFFFFASRLKRFVNAVPPTNEQSLVCLYERTHQ